MKKIVCAACKFEKFITDAYLQKLIKRYSLKDEQDILGFLNSKIDSLTCQECGRLGTARILEHNSRIAPRIIRIEAFPKGERPHNRHEGKRHRDRLDAENYNAAKSSPGFVEAQRKRLKELGLDE